MSFDLENYPDPFEPEPKRRRWLLLLIASVVIITMLASGIVGIIWLYQRQVRLTETRNAAAEAIAQPTVPATAVAPATRDPQPTTAVSAEDAINRIVFVNNNGRLGTIAPDSSDERVIGSGNTLYQFPAWSPDGTSLAAIAASRTGVRVVVLSDASETSETEIYASIAEAPFYLYWSPDSQKVSFLASSTSAPMALHIADADGNEDSHIVTTGGPLYWEWTRNSEQLFIHTGFAGADARLALIDATGDGSGLNIAAPGYFQAPGISADGRYLAYAEETGGGNSRVVIMEPATGNQQQQRHAGATALSWSPTASQVAFISSDETNSTGFVGPLRLLDAETGEVTLLSRETVVAYFWSPDGRYLAFLHLTNSDTGEMNAFNPWLPSSSKGLIGKNAVQTRLPDFDLSVIDVASGGGRTLISGFKPSLIFVSQFLPFFDQYAMSHSIWSPQSDALVLPIVHSGKNQIAIFSVRDGRMRLLTEGNTAFWSRQ